MDEIPKFENRDILKYYAAIYTEQQGLLWLKSIY